MDHNQEPAAYRRPNKRQCNTSQMIPRTSQEMLLCPDQDQLLEDGFEALFDWQDKMVIFPLIAFTASLD